MSCSCVVRSASICAAASGGKVGQAGVPPLLDLGRGPRIGGDAGDVPGQDVVADADHVGDDVVHRPLRAGRHDRRGPARAVHGTMVAGLDAVPASDDRKARPGVARSFGTSKPSRTRNAVASVRTAPSTVETSTMPSGSPSSCSSTPSSVSQNLYTATVGTTSRPLRSWARPISVEGFAERGAPHLVELYIALRAEEPSGVVVEGATDGPPALEQLVQHGGPGRSRTDSVTPRIVRTWVFDGWGSSRLRRRSWPAWPVPRSQR